MSMNSAGKLRQFATGFLATAAATIVAVQFGIVWISICGATTPSLIALLLGATAGLTIAGKFSAAESANGVAQRVLLSVALLCVCGMANSILDTSLMGGVSFIDSIGMPISWSFGIAGVVATIFSWLVATWLKACCSTIDLAMPVSMSTGAAFGCLVPLSHVATVFPITITSCVAVALAMIVAPWRMTEHSGDSQRDLASSNRSASAWLALLGFGLFAQATFRMMNFLTPVSVALLLLSSCLILLASAATMNSIGRKFVQNKVVFYCSLLVIFFVPLSFRLLTEWNLHWNATVDSVTALMLWRSAQLSTILLAAALICRNSSAVTAMSQDNTRVSDGRMAIGLLLGITLGLVTAASGWTVAIQMCVGATLLVLPVILHSRSVSDLAVSTKLHPAVALSLVSAGLLCAVFANIDSATTSQRLFSTKTATGLRLGMSMDVADQSHCTRLVDQQQGATGDLTLWRTSADLLELRRNGIPAGTISTNELTTPQPLADALTAILPLAMHRAPQHVLVLGDDSGLCTRVCCNSPIPFVEVTRSDKAATNLFAKLAWDDLEVSPMDDERVTMRHEPVAATIRRPRAAANRFDVVIASSPNPITLSCQEQLTSQFYANVRSQLNANGVFCQRITQYDLGSQPVLQILSSISTVFNQVVVVQVAVGEMVMIAAVGEDTLLDEQVLNRLQRSHVTRELSRSGWDWSQVAALPVVDTTDPVGIYEHIPQTVPVTAESGYFALSLPLESARWGNKPAELRQTFAPHQQRLADAAPRSDAYREYAIRFSAVVQQMEILSTFHDQPWTYRKSLKTEMMRNSRPPIEKIVDGNVKQTGDPRDEYRKDYLISLGQTIQQAAEGFVDPMALKKLASFTNAYEPLLSFFAHHELIRIHETVSHPSPALELRHRLHTIFFADGRDYSVRQVVAAMKQIVDAPELLPTPEARFDHLNAMLQELVRRWDGRRTYTPKSARQAQQDIDDCIKIANRAMDKMEQLADTVKMSRRQFLARRKYITKTLISPLRSYGEQVLAHRIKTEPPLETTNPWQEENDLPMLLKPSRSMTTN